MPTTLSRQVMKYSSIGYGMKKALRVTKEKATSGASRTTFNLRKQFRLPAASLSLLLIALFAGSGCESRPESVKPPTGDPYATARTAEPAAAEVYVDTVREAPPGATPEPHPAPEAKLPAELPRPVTDFERFQRPFPPAEGARPEIYTDPRSPHYFDHEEMERRSLETRALRIRSLESFEFQGIIVHDAFLLRVLEQAVRTDERLAASLEALSESDIEVRVFQSAHRGVPIPYQGRQGLLLFDRIVPIEAGDDWPTRTIDVLVDHHGIDRVAHFIGVDDGVSLAVVADRIEQETASLLARELRKAAAVALAGGRVGASVEPLTDRRP